MKTEVPLLDVKLLRLLDTMHSTGSVTRTAELLGQSQPTISIGLGRLREQLGDQLFVRTPLGMQPTPRTEALIGHVREVLEGLRRLSASAEIFEFATAQREFRIYMTDASHITLLPRLFTHVRALAPQVRLEAATINTGMVMAMQSGDADLALGLVPGLDAGFYQQVLFDQDWVCLAHPMHSRIDSKRFTVEDYVRESHIGIVSGTGQQLLEASMKAQGIERQVVLKLPGFLGLPAIISATDLVATLPRHIGETLARVAGLQVLQCPVPIPEFTVKQYWHSRYHHDPANRWLRSVCVDLFSAGERSPST